jgi:divalent metal cation (Fe/Co/Zn/Cd) transporter
LRLEYLTLGWEVIEAAVALAAASVSGSVALLGFGIDSVAELASATILVWRLKSEQRGRGVADLERIDRRARRMVAASLFVLAGYVTFDAITALLAGTKPGSSIAGIAITAISMLVMWWLGRAKRSAAASLSSGALFSDAFQATACFWLCLITLTGLALNMALGWWWADPVAALAMVYFIVREGFAAWRGEECSC